MIWPGYRWRAVGCRGRLAHGGYVARNQDERSRRSGQCIARTTGTVPSFASRNRAHARRDREFALRIFQELRRLQTAGRRDCASTTNSTFLLGRWHLCTIVAAGCCRENEFSAEGGVTR
jgi:hypothetical protein